MAYIDRETAIKTAVENYKCDNQFDAMEMVEAMESIPTADVVEVVRCKDCRYYKPYDKPIEDFDGLCIVRECETDENEFCSYGKRSDK